MEDIELVPITRNTSSKNEVESKVENLETDVENVKQSLHSNIEKVIDNIEQTYDIDQKSQEMAKYSKEFYQKSKQVKRVMWWKSTRVNVCIALGIVCIVYYVYSEL